MEISREVLALFPYSSFREGQKEMMSKIEEGLKLGVHVLINGSTGIGKTVSILTPLINFCKKRGCRIIYLTRTHTQQEQALLEFSRICERGKIEAYGIGIQGKKSLCPLLHLDARLRGEVLSYDEFSEICETLKNNTLRSEFRPLLQEDISYIQNLKLDFKTIDRLGSHKFSTCPFFYLSSERIEDGLDYSYQIYSKSHKITAHDLLKISLKLRICPYLLMKELMANATLIVSPYNYIFQPELRSLFLTSYLGVLEGEDLKNFCLVVDEAHNLPGFLMEVQRRSLSYYTIRGAFSELERYHEILGGDLSLKASLEVFDEIFQEFLESIKNSDEGGFKLDLQEFYERLKIEFGRDPYMIAQSFLDAGEKVISAKREEFSRKMRRRMRSFLRSVGRFLSYLSEAYYSPSCYLFVNPGPSLVITDFDTSKSGEIVNDFWCSIHSSGTLIPFEAYSSEIGISSGYIYADVGRRFLKERRRIFYHPKLTTRHQELEENTKMVEGIRKFLFDLLKEVKVKALVFFPSYEVMNRILEPKILGLLEEEYELVLQEDKRVGSLKMIDLIRSFKEHRGLSLFFGVIGGRISEGIDFPERSVEMIVVVGLPYPRPDPMQEAKYEYYSKILGDKNLAWLRAYEVPMIRRLCQAMGRLIRGERDYGVVYVIDRRMAKISKKIRERATPTDDPKRVKRELEKLREKFSIIRRPLQRQRSQNFLERSLSSWPSLYTI